MLQPENKDQILTQKHVAHTKFLEANSKREKVKDEKGPEYVSKFNEAFKGYLPIISLENEVAAWIHIS